GIKPQKVIQIGCGISTAVMLRAAREINHSINIVCIEPYPSRFLKDTHANGTISLIEKKAQEVPMDVLTALSENDLFFVDSTHTVKTGSEVNRIILEVLPRFKKGVMYIFTILISLMIIREVFCLILCISGVKVVCCMHF